MERLKHQAMTVERWLLRAAALGVLLLVGVQVLLQQDPARGYLTYIDRIEGERLDEPEAILATAAPRTYVVVLHLVSREQAERARLLVNGVPAGDFGQPRLQVQVRAGDVLEIDGSAYQETLRFRVTATSRELVRPALGREIMTRGDIRSLGTVALLGH